VAPAGVAPGGIVLALPPPMYRQEAPRSKVFTEQAVSESIAPVNGMDAGLEKPAPPQLVVPAVVVYLSERPDGAQVVLVVLGAALLVVVVGAALDVVVVAAALLVVVVGAALLVVVVGAALDVVAVAAPVVDVVVEDERQGLCEQEIAPRDVPLCLAQLSAVNCPHVGAPFSRKQQATLFVGFTA